MDILKGIFGIRGDNIRRAAVIAALAEENTRESRELNAQLREYQSKDDPFIAMMTDLHNKRTFRRQ